MAGKSSRDKGARIERAFAAYLNEHGIEARRGRQYSGGPESPDVVTGLDGIHFEVKGTERFNLKDSLNQAIRDAKNNMPVVALKQSRRPWIAVLLMDDLISLLKEKDEAGDLREGPVEGGQG